MIIIIIIISIYNHDQLVDDKEKVDKNDDQ